MQPFPQTIILRHRRENLKKCSLRGLEGRSDFLFFTYPPIIPPPQNYMLLAMDAPVLSLEDQAKGLFLIDATWRYADKMAKLIKSSEPHCILRSLPGDIRTAYPRRQEDCADPEKGLASIEALYAAYLILGRDPSGLLDSYHWKDLFIQKNKSVLEFYSKK